MDANTRFEALARIFYREVGILPPGKDVAAASGDNTTEAARRGAWEAWLEARKKRFVGKPQRGPEEVISLIQTFMEKYDFHLDSCCERNFEKLIHQLEEEIV